MAKRTNRLLREHGFGRSAPRASGRTTTATVIVDAADYSVWRDSLGRTGTGLAADGNGDHAINHVDYDLWKMH